MDASYLGRKLDSGVDLRTSQAEKIDSFFSEGGFAEEPANDFRSVRRVPVYGYAAAGGEGGDRIAFNSGEILDWEELPSGIAPRGDVFIVRTLGSSMEPRIFEGEKLVVQRNVTPTRDRDAVIEFNDGSAVVKTYRGQRDGKVWAQQYNDERSLQFDAAKVKAIHNVYCRL